MEFVAGRSLRALLDDRTKLGEGDALAVMADVCRALGDAHRQGIVHRDVKPENVLLIDDPPGFRVKLTDFGLARQVEQSGSLNLTHDKLIGTPLYMSPEQGQAGGQVDARTDVYALGATLFHVLAGRPPFLADTRDHEPAIVMPRIEKACLRQGENLGVHRAIHGPWIALLEIGPPTTTDQQAIAGERHALIVQHICDAAACMPRRRSDLQVSPTEGDPLAVLEIAVRTLGTGGGAKRDPAAQALLEG